MKRLLFATAILAWVSLLVVHAANPLYDPRWSPNYSFRVRFNFLTYQRVATNRRVGPTLASEIYTYTVEGITFENGRQVARILAVPDDEGWSRWRLTLDATEIVLLSIEEVDAANYVNPFGADAWMANLNQFNCVILHDFPRIPNQEKDESRYLSAGGGSTLGFSQSITFSPGHVTAVLSRVDPQTSLPQQTRIVWQVGSKWWNSATMQLGSDIQVTGTLLP